MTAPPAVVGHRGGAKRDNRTDLNRQPSITARLSDQAPELADLRGQWHRLRRFGAIFMPPVHGNLAIRGWSP